MQRRTRVTLILLSFLLIAATASAQQHVHGAAAPGERPGYVNKQRFAKCPFQGLGEEQQTALGALQTAHREAIMPLVLQLRAKRAELDVLLVASEADRERIVKVSGEIIDLHGQILAIQNDYRRKVFEETGRLVRGGMDRFTKGHGQKPFGASMRSCPRMSARPSDQPE